VEELIIILIAIIGLVLVLSGIYFILNAIWELRIGSDRKAFLRNGVLGAILLTLGLVSPSLLGMVALMPHHGMTIQSSSSVPLQSVNPGSNP
jgi:hypothetical protein